MNAQELYQKGLDLKSKGHFDLALTEFRRAVLADNTHFPSLMEIGALCKEKSKIEPLFLRHSFEAYRSAARLDLNHAEAHNQYIMAGQKMGLLEDLHEEYARLSKADPSNALLAQCNKNVVALSMA